LLVEPKHSGALRFFWDQGSSKPASDNLPRHLQTILKVRCRVHKRKICPDILDADTSGYLDVEELAHLLVGWGLPASESKNLTKELDLNGNGELDCKEFEKQLKPVWTCMVVLYGEIDPVS